MIPKARRVRAFLRDAQHIEAGMVRPRAVRRSGFESASKLCAGDLPGNIVILHITVETAFVKVDRGDGSDPRPYIRFCDGNLSKKVNRGLSEAICHGAAY
jgi:hypothetical protein